MKQIFSEFLRRGIAACGLGPMVLGILYLIQYRQGLLEVLPVEQVCLGIFSLMGLAFIAGGLNVLYQIEQLPLMAAILIHGLALYLTYLLTYLVNGWLDRGMTPFLVFSGIFAVGYLVIWAAIYAVIKRKTAVLNEMLQKKRQDGGQM